MDLEIQKQTKRLISRLEVRNHLSLVNRSEGCDSFDFNHELVSDKEVGPTLTDLENLVVDSEADQEIDQPS